MRYLFSVFEECNDLRDMNTNEKISSLKGVGPKMAACLRHLGIEKGYDLLTWYPRTYDDQSVMTPIAELSAGETATVSGTILHVSEKKAGWRGISMLTAMIDDGTGFLQVTWFNQKFLQKQLIVGKRLFLSGKITYAYGGRGQLAMSQISSYQILEASDKLEDFCGILPIYSTTENLNQKKFRKLISQLFLDIGKIKEIFPDEICRTYHLMSRNEAFHQIHFPSSLESLKQARKRLAFEELFLIQCGLMILKKQNQEQQEGICHSANGALVAEVKSKLPFHLTKDQENTWFEICGDMERTIPMRRLVQGDVGSGKTVIAMLALVKTVENGFQGAMMAPTEILAEQHYDNFFRNLTDSGIRVGFLSGKLTKKQREIIYEKISLHELDVLVGTHALIQEGVRFHQLGLVVTDEQHRFGIAQRAALEKKGNRIPDVLVMTATPIPRTMTLTVYGDLEVSLIRELPPGRKPVRTFVRTSERRTLIYQYVRQQIGEGRQAYVVCPRIEAKEDGTIPSVEEVYEELSTGIFYGVKCGLLHGHMNSKEKEAVMQDFYAGNIKLLVSTTVIEVGVNVPNANTMVIEHADYFGLSQLHQLRGRIGRGPYASYCILVSDSHLEGAKARLHIMESISDGFLLAEEDLKQRGPGQFFGSMQHGLPDLKIANVLSDMELLLEARKAAMEAKERHFDMSDIVNEISLRYREHFLAITKT